MSDLLIDESFQDYAKTVYGTETGTAHSYIKAVEIIDGLFREDDVFSLEGLSIAEVRDSSLIKEISSFVKKELNKYKRHKKSFFDGINPNQESYAKKGFCSAAMTLLLRYNNLEKLDVDARKVLLEKNDGSEISKHLVKLYDLKIDKTEKRNVVKTRVGQNLFRRIVVANFGKKCCVTGLNIPELLRASHISAWADDKQNRLNPENGLCLSATYDAAFDKHLISFDDDYRMILSSSIREYFTAEVTREYFQKYEGRKIDLPFKFYPSKQLLAIHRNKMK